MAHTPTMMVLTSGFIWLVPIPLGVRKDGKRGGANMVREEDSPRVDTPTHKDGAHLRLHLAVTIPLGMRKDGKRGKAKMMRGKDSSWVDTHTNKDGTHLWLPLACANPTGGEK